LVVVGLVLDELGALTPLEGVFLQLMTPVQRLASSLTGQAFDTSTTWRDLRDLRSRNEQLESLADQLMVENVRLNEFGAQNEDLRKKLNFAETHPEYMIKAAEVKGRVIGSEPNNFMSILIIDIGKRHGVSKGMPVVTERGLVGHIRSVGTNWAKVLLIIDPSSSVAAMTQSMRAPGIVSGRLSHDLVMDYIPQEEEVAVGDVVLTSGMGGSYPKALVIGQVTEVRQRDIEAFQHAIVHPSVNFQKLETVLVITGFEPVDVEGAIDSEYAPEPSDIDPTSAQEPGNASSGDQPDQDTTPQPTEKTPPVP
jgi:rod shape-determining protein MreC